MEVVSILVYLFAVVRYGSKFCQLQMRALLLSLPLTLDYFHSVLVNVSGNETEMAYNR